MNKRLGAGLFSWCEPGRDSRRDGGRDLGDFSAVVVNPGSKLFDQLETAFAGSDGIEADGDIGTFSAAEIDGDAAGSQ